MWAVRGLGEYFELWLRVKPASDLSTAARSAPLSLIKASRMPGDLMGRRGRKFDDYRALQKIENLSILILRDEPDQYCIWNPHGRWATIGRGYSIRMLLLYPTREALLLLSLLRYLMFSATNVSPYSKETSPGNHTLQTHSTSTPRIKSPADSVTC